MFDRYTDRARRSLVLAQEEANSLRHPEIDADCLLLGLAAEGEGVAGRALAHLGADATAIRNAIAARTPPSIARSGTVAPFTREAARALDLGLREAITLNCNYIGTEHLLLGLAQACENQTGGPCAAVLESLGVTPTAVREAVMSLLRGFGPVADAEFADCDEPEPDARTRVRFPAELAAAARQIATDDGKDLGEWVRGITAAEIARREGKCSACGQALPSLEGEA